MIKVDDIKHLAKLSRIEITEEESINLTKEIDSILGYVSQITNSTADIEKVVPNHHNIMREDQQTNQPKEYTEKLLANAPFREGNYLKVKKILGNSDDII